MLNVGMPRWKSESGWDFAGDYSDGLHFQDEVPPGMTSMAKRKRGYELSSDTGSYSQSTAATAQHWVVSGSPSDPGTPPPPPPNFTWHAYASSTSTKLPPPTSLRPPVLRSDPDPDSQLDGTIRKSGNAAALAVTHEPHKPSLTDLAALFPRQRVHFCTFYVRYRWCRFGNACKGYHPSSAEFAAASEAAALRRQRDGAQAFASVNMALSPPKQAAAAAAAPSRSPGSLAPAAAAAAQLQQQQQQQQQQQLELPAPQAQHRQQEQQQEEEPVLKVPTIRDTNGVVLAVVGERLHPVRPGMQACQMFMKGGACKWGKNCRHDHPLSRARQLLAKLLQKQQQQQQDRGSTGSASAAPAAAAVTANGNHATTDAGYLAASSSGTGTAADAGPSKKEPIIKYTDDGKAYVLVQGKKMPVRPNASPCRHLLKIGACDFGMSCRYNHVQWATNQQAAAKQQGQQDSVAGSVAAAKLALEASEQEVEAATTAAAAAAAAAAPSPASAGSHMPAAAAAAAAASGVGPSAVPLSVFLLAVDNIWPPDRHHLPEIWAQHHLCKYLLLRTARSTKGSANVHSLESLLAMQDKLDKVVIQQSDLYDDHVMLSNIGAELGLLWRKQQKLGVAGRAAEYTVKLGPLIRQAAAKSGVLVVENMRRNPAQVWVWLELEALLLRGGMRHQVPKAAAAAAAGEAAAAGVTAELQQAAAASHATPAVAAALDLAVARAVQAVQLGAEKKVQEEQQRQQQQQELQSPVQDAAPAAPVTYELLVNKDTWAVEFRPAEAAENLSLPNGAVASEAEEPAEQLQQQRDDALWSLLALLPTGLAALVEPYCWYPKATSHCTSTQPVVLTSIHISGSGPTVLRFRGGGRKLLEDATFPAASRLEEILARLGACGELLTPCLVEQQQQQQQQAAAEHDVSGSGSVQRQGQEALPGAGWSMDASTSPADPFMGSDALLVPGTLHRAVATRDACSTVTGVTYRIGRSTHPGGMGTCPSLLLADILAAAVAGRQPGHPATQHLEQLPGSSAAAAAAAAACSRQVALPGLLLLGPPGSGKTTLLRALARAAALQLDKSVLVLDNSWELGGLPLKLPGSTVPAVPGPLSVADLGPGTQRVCLSHLVHQQQGPGLPASATLQALVNAIVGHLPDVVVIDDMQSEMDAGVACQLAARGVVVLAAAHVKDLSTFAHCAELSTAVGICAPGATALPATASSKPSQGQQVVLPAAGVLLQRTGLPCFSAAVELLPVGVHERGSAMRVYTDVDAAVARLVQASRAGDGLAVACTAGGVAEDVQLRTLASDGKMLVTVSSK